MDAPTEKPKGELPFKELQKAEESTVLKTPEPSTQPPENPFAKAQSEPKKKASSATPSHPFAKSKKKMATKNYFVIGILIGLGLLGLFYYFMVSGRGEIVILDPTPGLQITVNNRTVSVQPDKNGYKIPQFAGQYRLQINKTNYLPYTQDISVRRGQRVEVRPAYAFQPTGEEAGTATVYYVRPSTDGKSVFYLGDNRRTLYRMDVGSQIRTPLTNSNLSGITDVQWSSEPDVALITRNDGVYLREIPRYDFLNQTLLKIGGPEVVSPVWDPLDPNRLAFAYFPTTGERSLVIADKRLVTLDRKADISGIPNPKITWSPDREYLLMQGRSSAYSERNLWIYKAADGSITKIGNTGVANASFSPDSGTLVYEVEDQVTGEKSLWAVKPDGSENRALYLKGTVAKVAWRDGSSFFLPGGDSNILEIHKLSGGKDNVPFSFPTTLTIEGMHYLASTKTLIFYTSSSIYTVRMEPKE